MKNYVISAIVATSLMMAVGCANKSPGQAAQDLKNQITGQSNQERNTLGLSGDWTSECSPYSIIPGFKSVKEQYHFGQDQSLTKKTFSYNEDNCQTQAFVRVEDGNYAPQGSSTPKEGVAVNFNIQKVSIVPSTPDGVKALNSIHYCTLTNFQLNQGNDVTAHSGDLLCVGVTKAPRATFDMVKLIDDTHLALGNDAKETDVNKRPTTVDMTKVFTKD